MLLLAIESAGPSCSVALAEAAPPDLVRVGMAVCPAPQACADRVIAMAQGLLDEAGIGWDRLDLLAIGRGPGSFTGVRTAVAAGRALALATGMPVLPLTSFEILAISADPPRGAEVLVAIDARRGQLYLQRFDRDREPLRAPVLTDPATAVASGPGPVHLVGSGAPLLTAALAGTADISTGPGASDAAALARAAAWRLARGSAPGPGFELQPLYLRAPDARPQQPWHAALEPAGTP